MWHGRDLHRTKEIRVNRIRDPCHSVGWNVSVQAGSSVHSRRARSIRRFKHGYSSSIAAYIGQANLFWVINNRHHDPCPLTAANV